MSDEPKIPTTGEDEGPDTVELSVDEVRLASALAQMREKIEIERRLARAKEAETTELRRQNEIAQRQAAWVRDLAEKTAQAISEMNQARREYREMLQMQGEAIREVQEEQARINDHVIEVLNRMRDGLVYILVRINGGDQAQRFRQAIEDIPGHPEDREKYESLNTQLRLQHRNLNKLLEEAARLGHSDLETSNAIDDTKAEIDRLEVEKKKLS